MNFIIIDYHGNTIKSITVNDRLRNVVYIYQIRNRKVIYIPL